MKLPCICEFPDDCYAMKQAHRFSALGAAYDGLTVLTKHGPRWTGEARFIPGMLDVPLGWRKPKRVFVNSMSDLFHDGVTDEQIAAVFGVMAACPQHTFQVLTKRPERMLAWFGELACSPHMELAGAADAALRGTGFTGWSKLYGHFDEDMGDTDLPWPLPNVWLGVSAEDQKRADERIPLLLECPAAVRFVSAEPLLGPLNLRPWLGTECTHDGANVEPDTNAVICRECDEASHLDWVIPGGESGNSARPCEVEWIGDIVAQCAAAGVACFVKQLGSLTDIASVRPDGSKPLVVIKHSKGGDPNEWPPSLRVRQFPQVAHG